MFKRAVILAVILFPVSLFSIDFGGKSILKVNGDEHKIDDIFTRESAGHNENIGFKRLYYSSFSLG